jgi:hypothetical protein
VTNDSDKDGYAAHISSGEATEDNDEHCTVCGYVINPTLDHLCGRTELTFVLEVPETCTTDGTKAHYECRCGKLYSDKNAAVEVTAADLRIPAHHVWSESWSNDETQHYHLCTVCGEKNDVESHTEDSGTVTTEPTETTEGVKTFKCIKCGYIMRTETIPPITPEHTHEYSTEWKTDSTSHWHECDCGEKADIAAHISNNGVVTVQPTATSAGLRVYSCSVCGYVLSTETIPATGFNVYPSYPTYPTYPFDLSIFNVVTFTDKVNVTAETEGNTITIKWDKVEKADKYYVYQYKDGKYVRVKTTTDTTVTLKGLKNGETYKFLVRYTKSGRLSPTKYSGTISVKVYYKPIPKPTAAKNSIKLTWEAVPEAEKYAIYKYVDGKAVKLTETKKLSVKIGKLIPDTEYKYIVRTYVDGKWTTMLKSDIVTVKTTAE